MKRIFSLLLFAIVWLSSVIHVGEAGGPLLVNQVGEPVLWDASQPVPFTPDQGPLGLLSNDEAVRITNELFMVWQDVPTASIIFGQKGQLSEDINGSNIMDFLDNLTSDLSPIIFDHDGSVTDAINGAGANEVLIGFAGPKFIRFNSIGIMVNIVSGWAVMNGRFFDGLSGPDDISLADFRGTFSHEFGHFIGLHHTQINLEQLFLSNPDPTIVPLMFPINIGGIGETLRADDVATVSSLYPASPFKGSTGIIRGRVFLPDGTTQFQGANVIARMVSNPKNEAVSSVSGFLHLDPLNPGDGGSSDPQLAGFYEIPGLKPGDYIVLIEQVDPSFSEASRVGPLKNPAPLPGIPEFFNTVESSSDSRECASIISVVGGQVVEGIDFIINRFGSAGTGISESEPNNSFQNPQALSIPISVFGNIAQGDAGKDVFISFKDGSKDFYEDIYSIQVDTEQWISVSLSFDNKQSDLDFFIFSEDETVFIFPLSKSPTIMGHTEFIGPVLLSPKKYFIGVSIQDRIINNPPTSYTLDITGSCIGSILPTATPTPTPASTPVVTPTFIPTPVASPSLTPTSMPSPTPTPTPEGRANLLANISPNPVEPFRRRRWQYNVSVTETNGIDITITRFEIWLSGALVDSGDANEFAQLFDDCGSQTGGLIPGFDTACVNVMVTGKPGTDTWKFSGRDANGNNIESSTTVTRLKK